MLFPNVLCARLFSGYNKKGSREIEKYPVDVHVYYVVTFSSKS